MIKNYSFSAFLMLLSFLTLQSCGSSTNETSLPERFVGIYKCPDYPNSTIKILNTSGEFLSTEKDGCTATGKLKLEDRSKKAGEVNIKIIGFDVKSVADKCEGIHTIGVINYEDNMQSVFCEDSWPSYNKNTLTQAIRFGSGHNGGDGGLWFKEK